MSETQRHVETRLTLRCVLLLLTRTIGYVPVVLTRHDLHVIAVLGGENVGEIVEQALYWEPNDGGHVAIDTCH